MNYATVCSGIEAPSVAWNELGFKPVFFSEIEPFPSNVLAHRFPCVPNLGDMTKIDGTKYAGSIDLICGGTPCQSFSIAGLRKGMADPRGNLALVFLRLVDQIRPKWVVWENVPGVLSSWSDAPDSPEVEGIGPGNGRDIEQTNDFDTFLAGLRELGYGVAWRILDAQYFGVPQRRRRVFVVGCLGDWQSAAAVLFERQSLRWDFTPRKAEGKGIAAHAKGGSGKSHWSGGPHQTLNQSNNDGGVGMSNQELFSQEGAYLVPCAVDFRNQTIGNISPTLTANSKGPSANNTPYVMATGQANAEILAGQSWALTCNHEQPIIFQPRFVRNGIGEPDAIASTLTAHAGQTGKGDSQKCVAMSTSGAGFWREGFGALRGREQDSHENLVSSTIVRRITPIEAERLQGFPDNYTNIPGSKDGPRYKALGNSMAVPVLKWIGERIKKTQEILNQRNA